MTINPANEAVLVTTLDITALRDADRVIDLLECDGIRDIKMIVNRVRIDLINEEYMIGFPLVLNKPPTLAGLAFEQAAWRLVEQDCMKVVMMEEEPKNRGACSFTRVEREVPRHNCIGGSMSDGEEAFANQQSRTISSSRIPHIIESKEAMDKKSESFGTDDEFTFPQHSIA
ncbi:hypothetical protein L1887_22347 [Cichorium endivia]|nr:hypothetical protein L1887_22347 [Cichorium endivia]